MTKKYILALDAGTTSSRAILFGHDGTPIAVAQHEFPQYFPQPGWVEHHAEEILATQLSVVREVLAKVGAGPSDVAALGITNQRETTIVWDRKTGQAVSPAIVWQCRRTGDFCDHLKAAGHEALVRAKTGLPIDAYFSGTKIRWILDNVPGARSRAEAGELLFGTVDTWLTWHLTGGKVHATDATNASRTMLYNIHTGTWDDELLSLLGIPRLMLPEVRDSSGDFGETEPGLFGGAIPIRGVAGDQQAALFGQACFASGDAKNTYGTGCFMLMNTGNRPVASQHGLITTVAWQLAGQRTYALEGSVFTAGAAIQWLRDELGIISRASESEALAASVPDTNGCYVVPAFTGLGAPYWDMYARGAILGLTRGVNRAHIVRATLASLAYQTTDVLKAMREDSGVALKTLRTDGGAAANNLLLQMQSDLADVPVERPVCLETTALGAAALAGLAVGYWKDFGDFAACRRTERIFTPAVTAEAREKALAGWHAAVGRVRSGT